MRTPFLLNNSTRRDFFNIARDLSALANFVCGPGEQPLSPEHSRPYSRILEHRYEGEPNSHDHNLSPARA